MLFSLTFHFCKTEYSTDTYIAFLFTEFSKIHCLASCIVHAAEVLCREIRVGPTYFMHRLNSFAQCCNSKVYLLLQVLILIVMSWEDKTRCNVSYLV